MSEETPKDTLSMLKMAQEVHDKMIGEAEEKKDQMIWEAEKIIRAAEETAASRIEQAEKESESLISAATEKAAQLERDAIEEVSIIEAKSQKEHKSLVAEIEKLQMFESEYRDKLQYLVSMAANTLEVEITEVEELPQTDEEESVDKFVSNGFNYDYDATEVESTDTGSISIDTIHTSGEVITELTSGDVETEVLPLDTLEDEGGVVDKPSKDTEEADQDEIDQAETIGDILKKD